MLAHPASIPYGRAAGKIDNPSGQTLHLTLGEHWVGCLWPVDKLQELVVVVVQGHLHLQDASGYDH